MPAWWHLSQQPLAELRRRRVLRTLAGYLVGGWVLLQVADVTFQPLGLPSWVQRALIIAVVGGIVPAAVLAWVFDFTRQGIVRTTGAVDAGANGAPTSPASAPLSATGTAAPVSAIAAIAVLPFADMSQSRDQDWFCDGLAEEIIDSLCCVRGLRVASRTASFRFRDGTTDPREIGRLLSVDAILEGSVRVSGDRLRVTAQLVDAHDGYHAWSETYERALTDVFAIQREIAENVARALKLSLAGRVAAQREQYAPRNLDAYEPYLRGRQLVGAYSSRALLQAPGMFRRAIERDPEFAQAWAGLADALALQAQWRFAPPDMVLAEGSAAAARALELAPDLAEAHMAQGHMRSLAGDAEGARSAFEHALELNPALFDAWHSYARDCYARGEYARAAELFQRAHRVRPDDFAPLSFAAGSLHALGDEVGSRAMAERAANGLVRQCELEPDNLRARYLAAGMLLQVGRGEQGRAMIEQALAIGPDDQGTLYNAACFYSMAGEPDRALDLLERTLLHGGHYPGWLAHDTDLDPLRGLPRFEALIASTHGADASPSTRDPP